LPARSMRLFESAEAAEESRRRPKQDLLGTLSSRHSARPDCSRWSLNGETMAISHEPQRIGELKVDPLTHR